MENNDISSLGLLKIAELLTRLSNRIKEYADKIKFSDFKAKFGEQDDDIYIVTYPRSGTTLLQTILYQLTTDGDMNFHHIYEVSPWIRNASYRNENIPEIKSPRIIKSHDTYKDFHRSTKGKFIFVYRNPEDVAVSLYHQNKNYKNPDLKIEDFIKKSFLGQKDYNWFKYTKVWLKNKRKFDILYLKYEDVIAEKESNIKKIVKFLCIDISEDIIKRTIERSSFEYMKEHEGKFGVQPPEKPKKLIFNEFIRKGKTGEGNFEINVSLKEKIAEKYNSQVKLYTDEVFQTSF